MSNNDLLPAKKFDPDAFMTQTMDQPMDTERTLVPEGEYKMMIDDFTSDAYETIQFEYKKGRRAGEAGEFTKFNCPCVILDDKVIDALGQGSPPKVLCFKTMTLDFLDDGVTLAWGPNKNIDLGQLRHATGQNVKGQPWNPSQLRGAGPFIGRVRHLEG